MNACCGPGRAPAAADCCAGFYEQPWIRELADNHFHPGGADLSRRTAASLDLPAGSRVLDLGCGAGTTALLLAREFGFEVTGIDVSGANIELARERVTGDPVRFTLADAHDLPFPEASFDAAIAECTLSLFAEPLAALAEVRRVLRPEGSLAVTDMGIGGPLPGDLLEAAGGWACLAGALNEAGWRRLFEDAGFEVALATDESSGLVDLLRQLKRRLLVLGAGALMAERLPADVDLATIRHWMGRFEAEIGAGRIRYLGFLLR